MRAIDRMVCRRGQNMEQAIDEMREIHSLLEERIAGLEDNYASFKEVIQLRET